MRKAFFWIVCLTVLVCSVVFGQEVMEGTEALEPGGDLSSLMLDGVGAFVDSETAGAFGKVGSRGLVSDKRERLAFIDGVRDARVYFDALDFVADTKRGALVGRSEGAEIYAVSWPAFGDVRGYGLLVVPVGRGIRADVVAVGDADMRPEDICGLGDAGAGSEFALKLAESGCRVLVMSVVSRAAYNYGKFAGMETTYSHREFVYRAAYQLGRHVIGYEVNKILAAVDFFERDSDRPIGVIGYGEGGLLCLHAGALDERIDAVCVSGYFGGAEGMWAEPMSRNIFGFVSEFSNAHLAAMIWPRAVVVEASGVKEFVTEADKGAGPGRIGTRELSDIQREVGRAEKLGCEVEFVKSGDGTGGFGMDEALAKFIEGLGVSCKVRVGASAVEKLVETDMVGRDTKQLRELVRHNEQLLNASVYEREEFWGGVERSSIGAYKKSVEPLRAYFYEKVIGRFDYALSESAARTRKVYDTEFYTGYEVVLDVFEGVFAYGIVLVPKGIGVGDKRGAVICMHGLNHRPKDTIEAASPHVRYKQFAAKLAEKGYVTFSPQGLFIFDGRFRQLQRKCNAIGKSLFSVMIPQHERIVGWLGSLDFVDSGRIGFYGLAYGGKAGVRVPAVVEGIKVVIVSGDFNDWARKLASTRDVSSYIWYHEYEIWEYDLANRFNHSDMAGLICPRAFMVEKGDLDKNIRTDWSCGEYGLVGKLYRDLGIAERTEMVFFAGGHELDAGATFEFIDKHLGGKR
jgi:cephalosporin-C deacetylase-like acetyl esterase